MKSITLNRLVSPKLILLALLLTTLLTTGVSLGSFYFAADELLARRGTFAFIPRDYRQYLVHYRLRIGASSAGAFLILGAGWLAVETLARRWQQIRNRELAAGAVLLRLAPRVDERSKWEAAADLWAALHSTLARPGWQVWLGAGLHLSLELVQQAGERVTCYLWCPRPVAETVVRHLRATYAGLEIETLIKSGEAETPTSAPDDYLDRVSPQAAWLWADLGCAKEAWRSLRTKFGGDPLASLLSTLEGLSPGNELAAIHFILRPAADGWQRGAQPFVSSLRGDNAKSGKPKLGGQERSLIKQIEDKGQERGYDLCLRLLVAGSPSPTLRMNLERLVRLFDQFADDDYLAVRTSGTEVERYRWQGRYFPAGWRASVVGTLELAALAHLPNEFLTGVSVTRARARLERPSPVSYLAPGEQRIVLGRFADVPSFGSDLAPIAYPFPTLRRWLNPSTAQPPTPNPPPPTPHPRPPPSVPPCSTPAAISTSSAQPGSASQQCCCG